MTSHLSTTYLQAQCRDGWWPYQPGHSESLEATAWCAIACRKDAETARAALRYLVEKQRPDGGWATSSGMDQSDWSTALALLAISILERQHDWQKLDGSMADQIDSAQRKGFKRLTGQRADVITDLTRVGMMLMQGPEFDYPRGWPWAADTYNWVEPSAYAVLAIKTGPFSNEKYYLRVVKEAQQYLFEKTCLQGGWNFGAPRTLGTDWPAMPPPTALALIAMQDVSNQHIDNALNYLRSVKGASVASLIGGCLPLIARELHGDKVFDEAASLSRLLEQSYPMGQNLSALAVATIAANLAAEGNPLRITNHAR